MAIVLGEAIPPSYYAYVPAGGMESVCYVRSHADHYYGLADELLISLLLLVIPALATSLVLTAVLGVVLTRLA